MTTQSAPAGRTAATAGPVTAPVAPPGWPWRRGAFLLAGAAQLITIEALLGAGIAGGIMHTGLFFVPALVVLAVGGVKLWREQP